MAGPFGRNSGNGYEGSGPIERIGLPGPGLTHRIFTRRCDAPAARETSWSSEVDTSAYRGSTRLTMATSCCPSGTTSRTLATSRVVVSTTYA